MSSCGIKIFFTSVIVITFLYSQILWAAGYELFRYTLDEETLITGFKSPDEYASIEARKKYLTNRQEEIDNARRLAFSWGHPLHEPNKELSKNLYYQEINATRALTEGKRYADEITSRIGAYGRYYIKHTDGMVTWYFNALLTDIIGEKVKDKLGHQSIQDTLEMLYNEKRQLISFKQKITDEHKNITSKIWDKATYWTKADSRADSRKGKNMLAGYHEEITYPTGEIIDRRVANLTYYTFPDQQINSGWIEEQIASYDEIKLSNQAPDAPTTSYWYNSTYLKRPFTYTDVNPSYLSLVWTTGIFIIFLCGFFIKDLLFRFLALMSLAILIVRIFFYDLGPTSTIYRILLLILGILLMLISFIYTKMLAKKGASLN